MPQGIKNFYHLFVAIFATAFFRYPAQNLIVIGVTGTDGKTTTVNLIYEILQKAGKKVAMVSSVGAKIGDKDYDLPFHVTTPSPWQLQKFLRLAADRGDKYLVLEVTSHGLDQNRVWGIPFKIGVLTNITHEHLDYHQTFEDYVKAKMKLFHRVEWAIINKEFLDNGSKVPKLQSSKVMSYGIKTGEVNARNFPFITSLPGDYNKQNCLAAIAVARILGVPDEIIREGIKGFKGVAGRFEYLETGKDFKVLIDFAHTPNGFENILATIRPQVKGKLIHVFGCASKRDTSKRPIMGRIAASYDDVMIVTEEDYREEDINKITNEILNQVQNDGSLKVFRISDRQEAINKAISLAKKDDLVLLTGKGHERSLCRGKTEFSWSEHEAVKKALI